MHFKIFQQGYVIEVKMRVHAYTENSDPHFVISFGNDTINPYLQSYVGDKQWWWYAATDSGYGMLVGRGSTQSTLFRKGVDSAATGKTYWIIPDSLRMTDHIQHLSYGTDDTVRWWVDGSSTTLRPKAKDATYKTGMKRISLMVGEGYKRTVPPTLAQVDVDWLLVRKHVLPVPTTTMGYVYVPSSSVPALPDSLIIQYRDETRDVLLQWSPVVSDTAGNPIQVDCYKVMRACGLSSNSWILLGFPVPPDTTIFVDSTGVETPCFYIVRAVKY